MEATELYNSILSIVKQIPRKEVEGDSMDASSCAYELEQLFLKLYQEQNKNLYSEQDVSEYAYYFESCYAKRPMQKPLTPSEWFEQYKNK